MTIKEIARLAGVSRGTVDRVLNNRGAVNPETETRIRKIMEEAGYKPNQAAKNLSVIKKGIRLGFLLFSGDRRNPFFSDVLCGIRRRAGQLREYGVEVLVRFSAFDDAEDQIQRIRQLEAEGIMGLALTPVNDGRVGAVIDELVSRGIPVVTANTDIPGTKRTAYVGCDYGKSGRMAGELMGMLTHGDAKIGITVGSGKILGHAQRVEGFEHALSLYCPRAEVLLVAENRDDDAECCRQVRRMLSAYPELNALYIASAGAQGACRAVAESGRAVSVIAHDTVPSTAALLKAGRIAATIGQGPEEQGEKPLSLLFQILAFGEELETDTFYTRLEVVIRENLEAGPV